MLGPPSISSRYVIVDHEETALSPELEKIHNWLNPTDYLAESGEFRRNLSCQAPGTGLWIIQTHGYKNVMASAIIQHLRTSENCPVLSFFRNIVADNFSPRALIRDWLAQLLPYSPKLQISLRQLLETSLEETSDNELFRFFLDGVSSIPKCFCIVDALDEMDGNDTGNRLFLDKLNSLATHRPQSLKLLITSRPKQYLQSALRVTSIVHIGHQQRLVDVDIMAYLHHRFDTLRKTEETRDVKQQVIDMVAKMSQGLFIVAKLTMDQAEAFLLAENPVNSFALEQSLPVGLEQTYTSLLAKRREENKVSVETQVFVLEAVTHSSRPLRLNELANLMEFIRPSIEAPADFKVLILEDETLQVIHHSFTEFLRGDTRNLEVTNTPGAFPVIESQMAHQHIAINCLRYLQSGSLLLESKISSDMAMEPSVTYQKPQHQIDPGTEHHEREHLRLKKRGDSFKYQVACLHHSFLSYAVENWAYHASLCGKGEDEELFAAIFEDGWPFNGGRTSKGPEDTEGLPTAFHIAAFSGLCRLSIKLIREGLDVSAVDAQGRIPLHWAAANGHAKLASLLIQRGSDPNAEDEYGLKPIHLAAQRNHVAVVRVLLEAGVEPDTIKTKENHTGRLLSGETATKGECAILYACQRGHTQFGRTDAVIAILEKTDVSANATFRSATALYLASLIDGGADVTQMSRWTPRRTINGGGLYGIATAQAPLHCLVQFWHENNNLSCRAILRMLIEAGADLEQAANFLPRYTLVEAGADLKKTNVSGDTPMNMILRRHRDPEIIQFLLKHGALHCAIERPMTIIEEENIEAVIKILLENGADPNIQNIYGKTPIYKAISAGFEISKVLLKNCADDAVKKQCWFGLSSESNIEKFTESLELLLAEGIDINTADSDERCLYLKCLMSEDKLRILRNYGAKTDCTDIRGNGALHILSSQNWCARERMQRRITEDGLDPLEPNHSGDTLLHVASSSYKGGKEDVDYVRWLISLGIPVNAVNDNGCTALHTFIKGTCYENAENAVPVDKRVHFVDAINYQNNVDFEIRDNEGNAALHLAAMRSEAHVKALLDAGADPNFLTENRQNLLHLSCQAGNPVSFARYFNWERTPLHYACISGEPESVAFLLNHGANPGALDLELSTPLHACEQFILEQNMWNVHDPRYRWQGPGTDTFRPRSFTPVRLWHRKGRDGRSIEAMNGSLSAGKIVELLLNANCNVAAVNMSGLTALDIAIQFGSCEFVEIFSKDEDLFKKATRKLDMEEGADLPERLQEKMKALMDLIRPRPAPGILGESKSSFSRVTTSIYTYLNLLIEEDVVRLINEGFESDPPNVSHYKLLEELMKPGHTQVASRVSRLIMHYSSYTGVRDLIERQRKAETQEYNFRAHIALELACQEKNSNMLMIKLLIESLHIDVNARGAFADRYGSKDSVCVTKVNPAGTALHILASADHSWQLEGMKYVLSHGAFVDSLNENRENPLHIAARNIDFKSAPGKGLWRLEAVCILLDHGANPNSLDDARLSPLHKGSSSPRIRKELLRRGADPTIGDRNPLFLAVHDQNLPALEAFLDTGLGVDSLDEGRHSRGVYFQVKKSRKLYALLCAAFTTRTNASVRDSVPLLRTLVQRGANLYLPLNDDETMIHFLCEYPQYEILDALLQEPCVTRIDFNRRDQRGRTVLIASCDWRETLSSSAYEQWHPKALGPPLRILDYGANATIADNEGKTALHHLIDNTGMSDEVIIEFINYKQVAPTLLLKDNYGFSPFHYASRVLRPELCNLLLAKGADLLEPDSNGWSVLHHIAPQCLKTRREPLPSERNPFKLPDDHFDKCLALWQRFTSEGGSINAVSNDGSTPLHTFLLSANVNSRTPDSVEHYLRQFERLFAADSGVDLFAQNGQGETGLHLISRRAKEYYEEKDHDKVMFKAFMAKGLDLLKDLDAKGRRALDVASAFEKDSIISIFGRK
ncbi:ankyrin repeat-containing domain protein [Daldinia caldariorum]|uniref:ankyrin repeat-containing domain protein n=1 Tax=Daldinia caldariorum TaxID=326644 RepID=UPI0020083014|nr:ankyrin repeat-containing domain protein [Daldinia caldariorum]KAI1469152.1 ankyrin repeat-containing domain protein [Daldinia caldariorum]